jgi:alanyl-tRNA synthetase
VTGNDIREKVWKGNDIRAAFLEFFKQKDHRIVRSSSLVPHGDPTLLFTNAGMNQFKDVFLGLEKREYTRATTAQKCVRAGGKHNDLENVGFTKRHHTFFEMMGNFSFGDYFKKDAIAYAWELITSSNWFGISKDKLYVTVFGGAEVAPGTILSVDEDAKGFWRAQNVPDDRIFAIPGLKENFWAMGDTGPCGPCSEIHYDMGPSASDEGHTDCKFPCDCGRYVEIWNLVFMQFNRDAAGILTPLPKLCVDTGMGLERVAAVLQGVISNYDTDFFMPLMKRAAELCGVECKDEEAYEAGGDGAASLRVIADHARATTFLITDGVLPSNEGRGYVLRKIMRRAISHGGLVGATKPFLHEMVRTVRDLMGDAYSELREAAAARVPEIVLAEERRFANTLERGADELQTILTGVNCERADVLLKELEREGLPNAFDKFADLGIDGLIEWVEQSRGRDRANRLTRDWHDALQQPIPGARIFPLYDTYGLPRDFIEDRGRPGRAGRRRRRIRRMRRLRTDSRRSRIFILGRARKIAALKLSSQRMARSTSSRRARAAKWCSTARRYMPNRAAKWQTPERSTTTPKRNCLQSITPSRDWWRTESWSRRRFGWETASQLLLTRSGGRGSFATIPERILCMRRCGIFWART